MLSTRWIKSSRSGPNGACVEARLHADGVEVRDSKDVHGPTLFASSGEWAEIITSAKRGGRR